MFELMCFVSSYHHERAEVLCPVTCLTAWWRSLWSAQVSYRKLLLACGLGALLGLPHLNRGSLSTSLALSLGATPPFLPSPWAAPACATSPGWRGTRAPVQAPESSHQGNEATRCKWEPEARAAVESASARCFSRPVYCVNIRGENLVYGSYRKSLFLL